MCAEAGGNGRCVGWGAGGVVMCDVVCTTVGAWAVLRRVT